VSSTNERERERESERGGEMMGEERKEDGWRGMESKMEGEGLRGTEREGEKEKEREGKIARPGRRIYFCSMPMQYPSPCPLCIDVSLTFQTASMSLDRCVGAQSAEQFAADSAVVPS
jgi:hypothetical protein